ncbi:MAG: hypothetical protein KIS85_07470 [Anaerolineales bacterium]|nr:hypothetical protein [Anaerolineales bacterium]
MEKDGKRISSLVIGMVLVGIGLLALISQWLPGMNFWSTFWPFFLVAFGAMFFSLMAYSGKSGASLAVPGSIFVSIGLLMLAQSISGHWASWAYAWTVFIIATGIGIYVMGWWAEREDQRASGIRVFKVGVVLLALFGTFFEMIFNSAPFAQMLFPTLLIGLGVYLIFLQSGLWSQKPQVEAESVTNTEPKSKAAAKTSKAKRSSK